jgi:hypothetical protein
LTTHVHSCHVFSLDYPFPRQLISSDRSIRFHSCDFSIPIHSCLSTFHIAPCLVARQITTDPLCSGRVTSLLDSFQLLSFRPVASLFFFSGRVLSFRHLTSLRRAATFHISPIRFRSTCHVLTTRFDISVRADPSPFSSFRLILSLSCPVPSVRLLTSTRFDVTYRIVSLPFVSVDYLTRARSILCDYSFPRDTVSIRLTTHSHSISIHCDYSIHDRSVRFDRSIRTDPPRLLFSVRFAPGRVTALFLPRRVRSTTLIRLLSIRVARLLLSFRVVSIDYAIHVHSLRVS